ncbi:hypothetical protein B0H11DRAFT_1966124 [Mycena galericulata]|nr:hypothetical protein B0H11DRAFT_1966124 [Mycena galericulata]
MSEHCRTELNNLAAQLGRSVEYADTASGPLHDQQWTSVVYVNRYEFGRGYAKTKGAAREAAAKQAVDLIKQGY